jgi:proteasome lid subunit RPN8/RPN11
MIGHCRLALPREACGALFGPKGDSGTPAVTFLSPIANRAKSPETEFAFDAKDWIYSLYEAERSNRQLLGIFHSHPMTSGTPSALDMAGASHNRLGYWIVSFARPEQPIVRVYRLEEAIGGSREFTPIPYSVI